VDLRALKQTLQRDMLRCQSPEMVGKEVWAHLWAYNLIRGLMAQAAGAAGLVPLQRSFKGAVQTVNAFAAVLWTAAGKELEALVGQVRKAITRHRVGERANRYEPRAVKRRPKEYDRLTKPRAEARARLAAVR
jgi:hypothetical protein